MTIKELNPATIGHLRKMDELGFNELNVNDIYTLLQYLILFTLPISDVKTLTKNKLQELTDNMAFELAPSELDNIVQLVDNHIKATHGNDFEAINTSQKGEKKTTQTR